MSIIIYYYDERFNKRTAVTVDSVWLDEDGASFSTFEGKRFVKAEDIIDIKYNEISKHTMSYEE